MEKKYFNISNVSSFSYDVLLLLKTYSMASLFKINMVGYYYCYYYDWGERRVFLCFS